MDGISISSALTTHELNSASASSCSSFSATTDMATAAHNITTPNNHVGGDEARRVRLLMLLMLLLLQRMNGMKRMLSMNLHHATWVRPSVIEWHR